MLLCLIECVFSRFTHGLDLWVRHDPCLELSTGTRPPKPGEWDCGCGTDTTRHDAATVPRIPLRKTGCPKEGASARGAENR